jgi:hypothetical protein
MPRLSRSDPIHDERIDKAGVTDNLSDQERKLLVKPAHPRDRSEQVPAVAADRDAEADQAGCAGDAGRADATIGKRKPRR